MDKNKLIEGAAKLVAKGAYDKAIKEYQKVLDLDAKDVRILQKMGELYQKKNDNVQAAQYFTRVAESYATDGFFLKAVALYKQVLRLDPTAIAVNVQLAELHQQLGLMSEAMSYYQTVASHYDKSGDVKSSLDMLRKMVDLDPDNVSSRIKLAELYARENMPLEAKAEFQRAADFLKKHQRSDDYFRVAERISQLEPQNATLAQELASWYLTKGDQKRALAKLQICFKSNPRSVETLGLLAQAFQALGQTSKTLSVLKELVKIHTEDGRPADAQRTWDRIGQIDPEDPDFLAKRGRASAGARAPSAPAPREPKPAAPAASAPSRPAPSAASPATSSAAPPPSVRSVAGTSPLQKLLTETDVYLKYGLYDKALEHLRKIFSVDPESLEAHEKAYAIYLAGGHAPQAQAQLLNVLRLCTRRGEVERGQAYLDTLLAHNPHHPEMPAFLAVLRPGADVGSVGSEDEHEGESIIIEGSDDDELDLASAPALDEDGPANPDDEALALAHSDVATDGGARSAARSNDDDDEGVVIPDASSEEDEPLQGMAQGRPRGAEDLSGEILLDEEIEASGLHAALRAHEAALHGDASADGEAHAQPADEAPLAPDENGSDEGVLLPDDDAYDEAAVLAAEASEDESELVEEPLLDAPPAAESGPVDEDGAADVEAFSSGNAVTAAPAVAPGATLNGNPDGTATEECEEAEFLLGQGLLEEAREVLETVLVAYPRHIRATALLARLEVAAASVAGAQDGALADEGAIVSDSDVGDAFSLAAELADDGLAVSGPVVGGDTDDFQYSVEEVFSEFKKGVERVVKPEDVDTHYDLGIAYKEMGLTDDAINEFRVALDGCRGKRKEIDCLSMMALLYVGRGEPAAAIAHNKQALVSTHITPEVARAITFEIAVAWEAVGEPGKALYHYQRIVSEEPNYRDAAKRAERLAAEVEPVEDALESADGVRQDFATAG